MTRAMQLTVPVLVATIALAGLSACMSDEEQAQVGSGELEEVVLQQEDLPRAFVSFDEGRLQAADQPRGESGWKARYRREGSPTTRGPLVVESRVDRFDDADGAETSLATVVRQAGQRDWSAVDAPEIGEESYVFGQRQDAVAPVQYFMVAWRHANVVASVTVSGFAGRVTVDDAVELAQAQQRRTEAAIG